MLQQTRPLVKRINQTHTGRRLTPTRPERVLKDIVDGNPTR